MKCQTCKSNRIANIYAKAKDLHTVSLGDTEVDGYLPSDIGIGGGSETIFNMCLDCGQIQGTWPLPKTAMELYGTACLPEEDEDEDEEEEEYKIPKRSWAERKKRASDKQSEILEPDIHGIVKDFK
jgi:hypothetical protein